MWNFEKKAKFFLIIVLLINIASYAEWADRFGSAKEVSLSELLEKPEAWLNVPVRIPLRFFEASDFYVPYRTRFSPDIFWNFSAWDIQSHIWDPIGFEKIYPYFYVEKDNPEFRFFQKLQNFQTVCVLAQVEGIFAGRPFIRVVWGSIVPGNLNIDNLKLLYRSLKFYKERNFQEAMPLFQKVFDSGPPKDIKIMIHKAIAKYYIYEKKSYYLAIEELKKAYAISPEDLEIEELAYRCHLYAKPSQPQVSASGVIQAPAAFVSPVSSTAGIPVGEHKIILEPDPLPEIIQEPQIIKEPIKKPEPKKIQPAEPKVEKTKPEETAKPVDIIEDSGDLDKEIKETKPDSNSIEEK